MRIKYNINKVKAEVVLLLLLLLYTDFYCYNSNLDFCIILDEFEVLLRLGPKILIFVILKLIKDAKKNWYGVFLCKKSLYYP